MKPGDRIPGLEITIYKFHDFSKFSMTVRTLNVYLFFSFSFCHLQFVVNENEKKKKKEEQMFQEEGE